MADPVTIGLAVGGTLLQAYGQYQSGQAAEQAAIAQQQQYQYQAAFMEQQAKQQQAQLDFQAAQAEQQAGQERAAAQRKFIEEQRKKRLVQSEAIAKAAASGGGVLDPTVVDILGDLEAEGTYNANVALYEGEERARDLENLAAIRTYEGETTRTDAANRAGISRYSGDIAYAAGQNEKQAATISSVSTLMSGGASLYDKYG